MRVILLGCGASSGVPMIGCDCPVCRSGNPKNRRSRVSCLIQVKELNLLIDTSPDLREQALANNVRRVDAVLYSHEHADHAHGLDDLRSFNYLSGDSLPVYGDESALMSLKQRFSYAFLPKPEHSWSRPSLVPHVLPDAPGHSFQVKGIKVVAFQQQHGKTKTLGYRVGDFAYSTDVDNLPESAFDALTGVKAWIVDCIRYKQSYGHAHLEKSLEWVARVKPDLAVLTHMAHEFDYDTLKNELPPGVVPGYDGMTVDL